jgi:hypothetical protein
MHGPAQCVTRSKLRRCKARTGRTASRPSPRSAHSTHSAAQPLERAGLGQQAYAESVSARAPCGSAQRDATMRDEEAHSVRVLCRWV